MLINALLYDTIANIQKIFSDISYPIKKAYYYIIHIFDFKYIPMYLLLKLNPASLAASYLGGRYRAEKIADNFATIYGYGPDLSSALEKLETSDAKLDINIPVISPLLGVVESTYKLLVCLPDEHPATVSRIKDQLNYLEKELAKEDLDPKMKKEIQNQIDDIEKSLNRIISIEYDDALSDFHYMDHAYQALLYYIFGGDPKDLIYMKLPNDDIHADIEKRKQQKLMEEKSLVCKMLNNIRLI